MSAMDEVADQAHEAAEGSKDYVINCAAVAVAVIATFLALCGVKGDNVDYGILQEQNAEMDMWSMYQAKSMKQYMYRLQADTFEALLLSSGSAVSLPARAQLQQKVAAYRAEVNRYETEKDEIKAKAGGHRAQADALNLTANQLDLTEVMLSLAIALLAITILTRRRWLLALALIPGVVGMALGAIALAGLPLAISLPGFLG